jgi:histidyl-tRNA synthetase
MRRRYDALVRAFVPPSTQQPAADAVGVIVAVERIVSAVLQHERVRRQPISPPMSLVF